MKDKTEWSYNTDKLALFGALCLFLSAVEYMIPKPLPFMRIGIANLPLMLALDVFSFPSFLILICIKVFGQALITGTLFSYGFLFSIAGTFCSALLMFALRKVLKNRVSFIGISVSGAMVSNGTQLALAYFFVFGESVRYIAPWFLGAGLVTGAVLGVLVEAYLKGEGKREKGEGKREKGEGKREKGEGIHISNISLNQQDMISNNNRLSPAPCPLSPKRLFTAGLLIMPLIVFNPSTELRVIAFLLLWILALIFRKKTNPLFTVLFIIIIVAFNLLIPHGKVLFSIGVLKITSGALTAGIHRAVTFQSLVILSKLTIREDLKLPGKFGNLLGESLRLFSIMMNNKPKFKGKNFIQVIDDLFTGNY